MSKSEIPLRVAVENIFWISSGLLSKQDCLIPYPLSKLAVPSATRLASSFLVPADANVGSLMAGAFSLFEEYSLEPERSSQERWEG